MPIYEYECQSCHKVTEEWQSVSDEPLTCMGGVVVRSIDGKVRVDNTFESRIERYMETVRTRVAKELFGQE